jgi:hypothetical protein
MITSTIPLLASSSSDSPSSPLCAKRSIDGERRSNPVPIPETIRSTSHAPSNTSPRTDDPILPMIATTLIHTIIVATVHKTIVRTVRNRRASSFLVIALSLSSYRSGLVRLPLDARNRTTLSLSSLFVPSNNNVEMRERIE